MQSPLSDPLINLNNNQNIVHSSANIFPIQNAVRYNTAQITTPRALNVGFTIPDAYSRMENTEGSLFELNNRQARPIPSAHQQPYHSHTFPYTHNLQPVPIYVDIPYRAEAGVDNCRPNENTNANEPFGTYTNRREAIATDLTPQQIHIDPMAESPNANTNPNNYQLIRPEQNHLMPFSHQNRASNDHHYGYPNKHILDQDNEQHNSRNVVRQPIYARQEIKLYRTHITNQMHGEYPPHTGEILDHRLNQNNHTDYFNSNALSTATNPPNYPNNNPQRNSYHSQRELAPNDRNYNKPIPITDWKVYFSGETNLGKDERGVNDFLTLVNAFKTANRINDDYMLRNVGFLLKGSALNWYLGVLPSLHSWPEFITRLKTKYLSDNSTFEILSEIENRTQGRNESASEYISEMVDKFRSMPDPLPEAHQCHIIQRNLSKLNALRLSHKRYRSVIKLEQACRNMESTRKHLKLNPFPTDRTHHYDQNHRTKRVNVMESDLEHFDTENTVNDSESENEEIHDEEEASDQTIFQMLPNDKRPYAKVNIFKTELSGLLDSGSSVSLLGKKSKVFIKPKHLSPPDTIRKIITADGTKHTVEAVANVPITFNGKQKTIKLLIVPGIPKRLILGTDFWQAYNIIPSILGKST